MALGDSVGVEYSSRKEILDAHAHVSNHVLSYINSMSLYCAMQLGIPDAIHKHGKPITLSELADALPMNKAKSHGLFRLMRILVHSKFFDKVKLKLSLTLSADEEEEEAYCLTRASRLLLRDEPVSMATLALFSLDPVMVDPWYHMTEWFQDESPTPFEAKHGVSFWDFQGSNAKLNTLFNEAMACDTSFVAGVLTDECRHVFDGLESMVDVGGGTGATAKAISDAFPALKCTVLDLPHVAPLQGCRDLEFVSGDMFEFVPRADAVFIKWVLHDWSDEECVQILEKCKEAITSYPRRKKNGYGAGGKVIVVEMILDDEKEDEASKPKLFNDLHMMTVLTGKERTEKEWANIFFAAGFKNYKINPVLGLRSVIEVFP